ncbi:MAG: hypothetical protein P3W93_005830 [Thermus sp.]|nr:hypothetical protein [Thermus sp.]
MEEYHQALLQTEGERGGHPWWGGTGRLWHLMREGARALGGEKGPIPSLQEEVEAQLAYPPA